MRICINDLYARLFTAVFSQTYIQVHITSAEDDLGWTHASLHTIFYNYGKNSCKFKKIQALRQRSLFK